jgi:hypothetical protein
MCSAVQQGVACVALHTSILLIIALNCFQFLRFKMFMTMNRPIFITKEI